MTRVTLKSLWAHKIRLFTTSLSVALGVSFIAGALMLGATIGRSFDDLFANAFRNTDAVVRGPQAAIAPRNGGNDRVPIDQSILAKTRTVPGVKVAEASVNGYAQLVDKSGKAVGTGGAPQTGTYWSGDSEISPWRLREGVAPENDDEIVIDAGVAKKAKLKVGDSVSVLTRELPKNYRISGIALFGTAESPAGSQWVFFQNLAVAQNLLGEPGKIDTVYAKAQPGITQDQLVARIKPAMSAGSGIDVITGKAFTAENQSQLKKDLGFITTFLSVFAGVALFVAAFIINNTFSIILAQRTKETALLRAIGARRRQVMVSMMVEAVCTGLFASIVGLLLGILVSVGLEKLLELFGAVIPTSGLIVPANAVIVSLVAGTLITTLASLLPARRSSKIPPIAALREVAIDVSDRSILRLILGFAVTGIGVTSLAIGLLTGVSKPLIPVGAGAATIFVGVAMLGPFIARPASRAIGAPLPKLRGQTGVLALENAMRNPRRTSATAAALMIGVALVTLAAVFFTSLEASITRSISRDFGGDFIISAQGRGEGGTLSPTLAANLRTHGEIAVVSESRDVLAKVDGKRQDFDAIDAKDFVQVLNLHQLSGNLETMTGNEFAVTKKHADDNHWSVGSTVPIEMEKGGVQQYKLVAIVQDEGPGNGYLIPLATANKNSLQQLDSNIFVNKAEGTSVAATRKVIDGVLKAYPSAVVHDQTQFKHDIVKQIDSFLRIFYALLGLAIFIALLGIANTLALSVFERTRELGLLRAVGMTRRQTRSMVRWESVIVALLGTALGLIIGVAFGWALVSATKSEGLDVLAIPWKTVGVILVVAALAGVLAAIFPARRAARLDVLAAIATE